MVYRTLHLYILRELLRIFLLTASALSTLMAFGGTFRPLTKQGIEISQLMLLMLNLMPAMLAYAIPIAALFAAVLVYWRMSTDNELTACRAGGISFIAIVTPAFFLGLIVASADLVFVNYVVPKALQATERTIMRDFGQLLVGQIGRQEKFQYNKLVVYADGAEQEPSPEPGVSLVRLHGMSATMLDPNRAGRAAYIVVGRDALLQVRDLTGQDAVEITASLHDASAFDPNNAFRRLTGSVPAIGPFVFPSQLKSKPKFLNWRQLIKLNKDPSVFPPVQEVIAKISDYYRFQVVSQRLYDKWRALKPGTPLIFEQSMFDAGGTNQIRVFAPAAQIDAAAEPDRSFILAGKAGAPIRIEMASAGKVRTAYTCDTLEVQLAMDQFSNTGVAAALQLTGNVMVIDNARQIGPSPSGSTAISGIVLPPAVREVTLPESTDEQGRMLLDLAQNSPSKVLRDLNADARNRVQELFQKIDSELHSRGSFSLSCLTLVLFGAALGILLRGRNPLAVFVLGFVPAIFLVLLITAGRQLAEGNPRSVNIGIMMIWGGNVILLALVAGVYAKLLRH